VRRKEVLWFLVFVFVCCMFFPVQTSSQSSCCVNTGDIRGFNQGCTTILYPPKCTGGLVCEDWYCSTPGCFTGDAKSCKTVSQACAPNEVSPCRGWECIR
jgi:hypothetical protein